MHRHGASPFIVFIIVLLFGEFMLSDLSAKCIGYGTMKP